MKIGMLTDTYLPNFGGAEIHVLELSRALRALGHEIRVCTALPEKEADPSPEFPVLRLSRLNGGGWRAFLQIPLVIPQLVRFIQSVDLLHCHYSFLMAAVGTLLGRMLGTPVVVTLHGLGTLDSSVNRSVLWQLFRAVSLKLAHHVIATSDEMRAVARRFTPGKRITIIPNGVNTKKFSPAVVPPPPEHKTLVILSMRRLAPKNGVQYLIAAAPAIIEAVPQARFLIAGEGKLEAHIRRQVADLGIEPYFKFIGIVPHDQTARYYRMADIVVFPSSAESTSLACLEAMAMEKAIVASALSAYQEMLGDNERGLLVRLFRRQTSDYNAPLTLPPDRIQALAEEIILLAQVPPLRQELGQAARKFAVAHYDWTVIAGKTLTVYRQTRATHRSR